METCYIPVTHAIVGDILARDIKNQRGVTLVPQNCTINQYLINRLIEIGISDIWVYLKKSKSLFSEKDYLDLVYSFKTIFRELSAGKEINYHKLNIITEVLVSDLLNDVEVLQLLNKVKGADQYTYCHSLNVAFYCMFIAKWLNLPKEYLKKITQAGLLHDIGKALIPLNILNKKGKLTSEEFEVIKKHPLLGYESIKEHSELSDEVKEGVLLHHERINGSGYPYRLKGDQLSLCPKIVAVADVYDAMTQKRVYKNGVTPFEVFKMFQIDGIEIFDFDIINILIKNLSVHLVGFNVLLDNGKQYEIVHIPPHDITSPILSDGSEIISTSTLKGTIKCIF